jgi:hypothetical protein
MNPDFSWLVVYCRLHALTDTVIDKRPPAPTEQEADGTQSGMGALEKKKISFCRRSIWRVKNYSVR